MNNPYPICEKCIFVDEPLDKDPCRECYRAFLAQRIKPNFVSKRKPLTAEEVGGWMSAIDKLLRLEDETLTVDKDIYGRICVHYTNAYVKSAGVLIGVCGRGQTIEEACQDYLDQISGKTLVIDAFGHRKEVIVL